MRCKHPFKKSIATSPQPRPLVPAVRWPPT
jgi:hypothetical protein